MSTAGYTFSPGASSFYERLDVPSDADQSTVDRAGKLAYKQYSEADRDDFLRLREAREALTDDETRQVYDQFCDELGEDRGTKAYNKWQSRGSQQDIARFIRVFEEDLDGEDPDPNTLWERIHIDEPVVTWSHGKPEGAVHVNFWDNNGKRLYINNVHPKGDIYLDLETEHFYTAGYEQLYDIEFTVADGENVMTIEHENVKLQIDLASSGGQNALRDHIIIKEPVIKQANFTTDEDFSVNLWEDRRLFINGFHPDGDIYISLDSGRMYKDGNESQPVSNIRYDVSSDGKELTLTEGQQRKIVIDLTGQSFEPDPDPSPHPDGNPIPVNSSVVYYPGVLSRVALGPIRQIIVLIGIILGLSVVSPPNIVSYPVIFLSGVVLYTGGIIVIDGSGFLALVDGRFGRAGFAAAVVITAVWYYFAVEKLITD